MTDTNPIYRIATSQRSECCKEDSTKEGKIWYGSFYFQGVTYDEDGQKDEQEEAFNGGALGNPPCLEEERPDLVEHGAERNARTAGSDLCL